MWIRILLLKNCNSIFRSASVAHFTQWSYLFSEKCREVVILNSAENKVPTHRNIAGNVQIKLFFIWEHWYINFKILIIFHSCNFSQFWTEGVFTDILWHIRSHFLVLGYKGSGFDLFREAKNKTLLFSLLQVARKIFEVWKKSVCTPGYIVLFRSRMLGPSSACIYFLSFSIFYSMAQVSHL